MMARQTGREDDDASPTASALHRLFRHPGLIAVISITGVLLTQWMFHVLVKPFVPGEVIDTLQAAGVRYELHFHHDGRMYNTVRVAGQAVMDTRASGQGLCLRLRATAEGRIEAECYSRPNARQTEWVPVR